MRRRLEEPGQVTYRAWMAQQMYLYSGWCMDLKVKRSDI